jgi:hypothetical protein
VDQNPASGTQGETASVRNRRNVRTAAAHFPSVYYMFRVTKLAVFFITYILGVFGFPY